MNCVYDKWILLTYINVYLPDTAYAKNVHKNQWFDFDDSHVSSVAEEEVAAPVAEVEEVAAPVMEEAVAAPVAEEEAAPVVEEEVATAPVVEDTAKEEE